MQGSRTALVSILLFAAPAIGATAQRPQPVPVPLPGVTGGVGFDDLRFSPELGRVLVPAGRAGEIFLINPGTRKAEVIPGFSAEAGYAGGHGVGTTSVDATRDYLFAIDRTAGFLVVLSARSRKVVASARLGGGPDYVRYAAQTGEVWVTEPDHEQIEIFSFEGTGVPRLLPSGRIETKGGPESLVFDPARGRAYSHLWSGRTLAIDPRSRKVLSVWPNGCRGSRGIALDGDRGYLLIGCAEGKVTALDPASDGKLLGESTTGSGVDIIAFDPARRRLFAPAADNGILSIVSVSADGRLDPVSTVATVAGSHCVATDDKGGAWVCDPENGRLLYLPAIDDAPAAR